MNHPSLLNRFLDHLQPFLAKPFFDQVPNKGSDLLATGQFATRLQEFGLWGFIGRKIVNIQESTNIHQ